MEDLPGLSFSAESVRTPISRVSPPAPPVLQELQPSPAPLPPPAVPVESSPAPPKPDSSKQPSDFYFGKCLGEGAYARVVHAKLKKNSHEFAVKIMEKRHIKKENKV
jgi:hypothetical protein